jgi:hypothetical protein
MVVVVAGVLCGCTLREVITAPLSNPVLVVEGVIDPRDSVQAILVQRSELGGPTSAEVGATVVVTDLDPHGCATPAVQLDESGGGALPGTYQTSKLCALTAGDRLTLKVTTGDGRIVTGATRVPGIGGVQVRVANTTASLPGTMLTLDRTRDSVSVNASLTFARALQVEAVRTTAGEDPISIIVDTTALTLPGNLVDPTGDGRTIFHAGCYYALTVAAMDTNYFDFVRSATNPLTGQGFLNHLNGAVGVFGSVAPVPFQLKVTAPQTDPREGLYQVSGRLQGVSVSVNVTWDVYRDPLAHDSTFAAGDGFFAFVDGSWVGGTVHTSANGSFPASAFVGQMFGNPTSSPAYRGIPLDSPDSTYHLSGTRAAPGIPFPVFAVFGTPSAVNRRGDTLTVVQTLSP